MLLRKGGRRECTTALGGAAEACTLIGQAWRGHTGHMRASLARVVAATIGPASAYGQVVPSSDVVSLQRLVFGMGESAFPDTPEKMNAQLRLASAYATGSGVTQDIQIACGLAESARHVASTMAGHDAAVRLRATACATRFARTPGTGSMRSGWRCARALESSRARWSSARGRCWLSAA